MPTYDYKCKQCSNRFSLFYKTYADYDVAHKACPRCGSDALSRLINRVAIHQAGRDYTQMSSGEMLSVLESGNSRQVGEMFEQMSGADPRLGAEYHEVTQRLLQGESMEKVERDLEASSPLADSDL